LVSTEPIDEAWRQLCQSGAYWAGYSGMLIGSAAYAVIFSLAMAISLSIWASPFGIIVFIGGSICCTALIGVTGIIAFGIVRCIDASLNWLVPSRYAAVIAACFTGFLTYVLLVPLFVASNGSGSNEQVIVVAILLTFLLAGAWLGTDREIRRFEQRVAFNDSDKVIARKANRFGIGGLLISTFWLAGTLAILGAAERANYFGENFLYIIVAFFLAAFVSLGLSAILVFVVKSLRWLQKKLFYRKRPSLVDDKLPNLRT